MTDKICLQIEFLAGTDIEEALTQAKHLAIQLQVAYITFGFNSYRCSVSRHADIEKGIEQFYDPANDCNFCIVI
jgi:hypothetical protein